MVYMANELAVKVKVNLDATQDALKTQFGKVQKYADDNPVKVALKVDKKSLESSLREAFGKDAANSIKKNLKNATTSKFLLGRGNGSISISAVKTPIFCRRFRPG